MKARLSLAGLLAAVLVWAAVPTAYAVEVSGDQSGTWTVANSPYLATGWVTVPAGQTLTIQSGVVVKFGFGTGLTVNGTLSARGTAAANITFTSNGDQVPAYWNGLYFSGGGTGTMEYCKVQYNGGWGGAGIWCQGTSSPTISRCEISYGTVGIRVSDTATPALSYDTIANCADWAVHLTNWAAMPTFQGNTYRGNKYNGVRFENATVPEGRQITWNHPGAGMAYSVSGWATIERSASLTLPAGLVVKFDYGSGLTVKGTLTARGTATDPIWFTYVGDDSLAGDTNGNGAEAIGPGSWNAVQFVDNGTGVMDYCRVRYNGGWGGAGILCSQAANPTVSNTEIAKGVIGLRASDTAAPTLTSLTIAQCTDWPVYLTTWSAMPVFQGLTLRDNRYSGVRFDNASVPENQQMTWRLPGPGIAYSVGWPTVERGASLNLPAGLVVKFDYGAGMTVKGTLNASGTAASPIVFTYIADDTLAGDTNGNGAENVGPGSWNCIQFVDNGTGTVDWCKVRFNGGWGGGGFVCSQAANPTISNSEVIAGVVGLRVSDTAAPSLTNLTITSCNDWPVLLSTWSVQPTFRGLALRGNRYYGARFDNATVPEGRQATWAALGSGIAYSVGWPTVERGASLTLPAGAILKFDYGGGMTVKGTLTARGTAASPIVFTYIGDDSLAGGDTNGNGPEAIGPGSWNRIGFEDNGTGVIEYCKIKYNGGWGGAGVLCTQYANPTISNCEITYASDGVRAEGSAAPVIGPNNILERNAGFGVQNYSTATINARSNWWGDASGPLHATLNPLGKGQQVADRVDFQPYLTQRPGSAVTVLPPVIIAGPSASNVTQTGATITWTTDRSSSTLVEYGTTSAYGSQATGTDGTSHSVALTGLAASTTYHFRVRSATGAAAVALSGDNTFTTSAATAVPPVITSGPTVSNVTQTGASITWTTDKYSTSAVRYGTTTVYGQSALGAEGTTHSVTLSGLSAGTTYHFMVLSGVGTGIPVGSSDYAFTTLPAATPPSITSGPTVSNVTQTGATITWTTDKSSSTLVDYGTTAAYGSQASGAEGTSHTVALSGLRAGTTYHYRVRSAAGAALSTQSGDYTFTTQAAPAVVTILRVKAFSGTKQVFSPLRRQVASRLRFELWSYTRSDSSDLQQLTSYTWRVPAQLGQTTSLGQLTLGTVAGVTDSIVFQASGARASFTIITLPLSAERVVIDPSELRCTAGQRVTFKAQVQDRYGNVIPGQSFGWHVVGGIGTIDRVTGAFVAGTAGAQGYVIAASSGLIFGDASGIVQGTGRVVVEAAVPTAFVLLSNYPNPFNGGTEIAFELREESPVRLAIYNAVGQEVAVLTEQRYPAGRHVLHWQAENQPSGVYVCGLRAGAREQYQKMLLVR